METLATLSDLIGPFVARSEALTGFSRGELMGTGMAHRYLEELMGIVAPEICSEFVDTKYSAEDVMASKHLAPLARNVLRMWYLGQWSALPSEWTRLLPKDLAAKQERFPKTASDTNHVISPEAYREGLVWRAISAHPMGAKQPGFGTWQLKPGGI